MWRFWESGLQRPNPLRPEANLHPPSQSAGFCIVRARRVENVELTKPLGQIGMFAFRVIKFRDGAEPFEVAVVIHKVRQSRERGLSVGRRQEMRLRRSVPKIHHDFREPRRRRSRRCRGDRPPGRFPGRRRESSRPGRAGGFVNDACR